MDRTLTANITIYVAPRAATAGGEVAAPAQNQSQKIWFFNMAGYTATVKDTYDGTTIGTLTSALRNKFETSFDTFSSTVYTDMPT
jgi:hypothetical protein